MADVLENTISIPQASDEEAMAALDFTARHYLGIGADELLRRLETGKLRPNGENIPGLSRVMAMVSFAR